MGHPGSTRSLRLGQRDRIASMDVRQDGVVGKRLSAWIGRLECSLDPGCNLHAGDLSADLRHRRWSVW
jgi:hypothetical protein